MQSSKSKVKSNKKVVVVAPKHEDDFFNMDSDDSDDDFDVEFEKDMEIINFKEKNIMEDSVSATPIEDEFEEQRSIRDIQYYKSPNDNFIRKKI